jgi:hypothetical protein
MCQYAHILCLCQVQLRNNKRPLSCIEYGIFRNTETAGTRTWYVIVRMDPPILFAECQGVRDERSFGFLHGPVDEDLPRQRAVVLRHEATQ